jgi:hypothetical protein
MLAERPTPRKVWKQVHRDIVDRLGLPCKLRFTKKHRVGGHEFDDGCSIHVNPTVAFHTPAHLILHEVAHHILIKEKENDKESVGYYFGGCCMDGMHCPHWAETLFGLYRKLSIPLPLETQFPNFAKIAGIPLYIPKSVVL